MAQRKNLENEIACRSHGATANRSATGHSPSFLLIDGIPRYEHSTFSVGRNRTDGGRRRTSGLRSTSAANNADIALPFLVREARIERKSVVTVRCGRNVNKTCSRVE